MVSEVYNCDCMEYMATIPDKFFDLVIADPPYRQENSPTSEMRRFIRPNKDIFQSNDFNDEMLKEFERVGKGLVLWGANNYWFPFKGFIAWDKQVRVSNKYSQVEIASLSENLSKVSTYVSISCYDIEGKIHPTQKPIALYAWILNTYTNVGDKIFDPMMGSQSSRIAAYKLGYDFYGCELDKDFFKKGCERFEKEIHGIQKLSDGTEIKQLSLFDD